MASRRVFIAIDVADEVRAAAARRIDELRTTGGNVRVSWEKPDKLHLTIKFLGQTNNEVLSALTERLAAVASNTKVFDAEIEGAGIFPNTRQPRILWLGVTSGENAIKELAMSVEDVASKLGFEREKRRFSPHLTIARIREPAKCRVLAQQHIQLGFGPIRFTVKELVIYESKLSPRGSVYTALHRHPFDHARKEGNLLA